MKHFKAYGNLAPEGENRYRRHIEVGVCASSLEKAVELICGKYPGITLTNVVHTGKIDYIEETP